MSKEMDIVTSSFLRIRERLHRTAMGILHDQMDADDAVQEAYVRMSLSVSPTQTEAEARGKLFRTMRNACVDRLRERQRFSSDEPPADSLFLPHYDENQTLIPLILKELPPLQRRVFELVVFEELEYQEVAERLEMQVNAVRVNMMRARQKVRQTLNPNRSLEHKSLPF